MFKKGLEVKPSSNIKSSERRKLHGLVNAKMEGLKVPEKLSKAIFNSTGIKKGILYFDAVTGDPLFYQTRDGDSVIPTLHGLWASIPNIGLPVIITHELVIDRLINGANLMIRGCIGPFGDGLKPGAVVAVVDYKNPHVAVAVGRCLMDLEGNNDENVPVSGVAVEIWTVIGDQMTSLGRSMGDLLKEVQEHGDENENENDDLEMGETKQEGTSDEVHLEELTIEEKKVDDECDRKGENFEIETETETDTDTDSDEYVMTTDDIDEMFKRSVLYTLSQDILEFPIPATQFMSGHVLKNLPPVDTDVVNMKKTSWKKTRKFLKAIEKDGLIKLKGKDDDINVISVAPRSDPRVSQFVPYRIKKKSSGDDATSAGFSTAKSYGGDGLSVSPLIIKTYLKPTNASRMMFNRIDEKYDAYYTNQEVKAIVQKYIKQNPNVVSKSNAQLIVPDSILQEFGIKKTLKRGELTDKVIASFSPYYSIYRDGDADSGDILVQKRLVPKRGKLPTIDITIESIKVGRRVVTRVSGCERFYVDKDKLASTLKVKCSGSTTITEGKDPKDGKIISVQGKHDPTVVNVLAQQWGVPPSACHVNNRVKGRRK